MAEIFNKPKYEAPKARLARLKAKARLEAGVRRASVPLAADRFGSFLRTGREG